MHCSETSSDHHNGMLVHGVLSAIHDLNMARVDPETRRYVRANSQRLIEAYTRLGFTLGEILESKDAA